jgi:hypothetical protein
MISVFIAESLDAASFYIGRSDGRATHEVLKVHRLESDYRIVLDRKILNRAIRDAANFSVFHLSCRGGDDGVQLSDMQWLDWDELAALLKPLASKDRLLVIASCSGGHSGLTQALAKADAAFGYVFGSTTDPEVGVTFTDSCLAWSVLYNGLSKGVTRDRARKSIRRINAVVDGDFVYRRWDGRSYVRFSGAAPPRKLKTRM